MSEETDSVSRQKEELRRKMLAQRRALSDEEIKSMSRALTDRLLSFPACRSAKTIMAYLAMKGEANLDNFIRVAMKAGKEIYIPVCLPERKMEAGRLLDMEHFEKGPFGIRNLPKGYKTISPEEIDLVLVPAAACGKDGSRLGMGGGYYDRFLLKIPMEKRVSVIWDFQVTDAVPTDSYDQKISQIITEERSINTKRG